MRTLDWIRTRMLALPWRWCFAGWALVAGALVSCGGGDVLCSGFPTEIVQQPQDATVDEGGTARYAVTVSSCSAYEVKATWQVCEAGVDPRNCAWTNVGFGFELNFGPAALADDGRHFRAFIRVLQALNTGLDEITTFVSLPAKLTVTPPAIPAIVTQPLDLTVAPGQNASFTVVAAGADLRYQWQRSNDGGITFNDIAGAAAADFTLVGAQLADDQAQFRVRVVNANGEITSRNARLNVSASAPFVLSDGTFADAEWTTSIYQNGNGGTLSAVQSATGGNPGAYRAVTLLVNPGPPGARSNIFSFHWHTPSRYDPAANGAIATIDYSEDALGPGVAAAMVLRQGANVYFASPTYQAPSGTGWATLAKQGLVAADFVLLAPDLTQSPQRPDFSAAGSPIEFGFLRALTSGIGCCGAGGPLGVDNWTVVVHR